MRTFICCLFISLLISGCGRKGALIYPEMTAPAAPTPVTAAQAGKSILLTISLPQKDQAGRRLNDLDGVTITKRVGTFGKTPDCASCTEGFTPFMKLYLELKLPESGVQRIGNQLLVLDSAVKVGEEYSYLVTPFTKSSQEGLTSPPVTTGLVPPPMPPQLKAEAQPTEIRLTFIGTSPLNGVFAGYNLYRTQKGEAFSYVPINKDLISGKGYVDNGLDRNLIYIYAARTVVKTPSGKLVESELSSGVTTQLVKD